jgi:hypothetical protein
MKDSDIKKYNLSLKLYTEIMSNSGKGRTIPEIRECLKTFETLEDYDKCRDLLNILRIEFDDENADKR